MSRVLCGWLQWGRNMRLGVGEAELEMQFELGNNDYTML